EKAEDMLYIVSGRFRLVESGIELPVGVIVGEFGMLAPSKARNHTLQGVASIVGEFGMLSPSNARAQTLECVEPGLVLSVTYSKVEELYVQNPAFGFYFLRLASQRLLQDL